MSCQWAYQSIGDRMYHYNTGSSLKLTCPPERFLTRIIADFAKIGRATICISLRMSWRDRYKMVLPVDVWRDTLLLGLRSKTGIDDDRRRRLLARAYKPELLRR